MRGSLVMPSTHVLMRVPPAQACTRSVQNSFDRSQTERPRVNARRTLTRAGGDRVQIAARSRSSSSLLNWSRYSSELYSTYWPSPPRYDLRRVAETPWFASSKGHGSSSPPYISAAEVMVLAVDFRFVEGAHAVVVVLAEAIVFERLPRHVDFVIVVLCVVLEGGRRFADDVGPG